MLNPQPAGSFGASSWRSFGWSFGPSSSGAAAVTQLFFCSETFGYKVCFCFDFRVYRAKGVFFWGGGGGGSGN